MTSPLPSSNVMVDSHGRLTPQYQAYMASLGYYALPLGQKGATANRPLDSSQIPLYVGQPYFDTTLNKPIWVQSRNPTVWCDATGASV